MGDGYRRNAGYLRCRVDSRYRVFRSQEALSLRRGVVHKRARSKGPSGPFFVRGERLAPGGRPSFVVVRRRLNYFELNIELLKQSVHTALSEIELLREGKHSVLAEIELFEFDRRRREMEIELFGDGTTFAERLKEAMQAIAFEERQK